MNTKQVYLYIAFVMLVSQLALPSYALAVTQRNYVFGNHIDTHQSTNLNIRNDDPEKLTGTLHIFFPEQSTRIHNYPLPATQEAKHKTKPAGWIWIVSPAG